MVPRLLIGLVLYLLACLASVDAQQEDAEAESLTRQIIGSWVIDQEEYRKALLESETWSNESVDEFVRINSDTAFVFREDGFMRETFLGMCDLITWDGRWSHPRVDVPTRTVEIHLKSDNGTHDMDIKIEILGANEQRKLRVRLGAGYSLLYKLDDNPDDNPEQ